VLGLLRHPLSADELAHRAANAGEIAWAEATIAR
jgi:hypothetical protein